MQDKKLEKLKHRDEAIWRKYNDGVDEQDLDAVYRCGIFLGCYGETLVVFLQNIKIPNFLSWRWLLMRRYMVNMLLHPKFPTLPKMRQLML